MNHLRPALAVTSLSEDRSKTRGNRGVVQAALLLLLCGLGGAPAASGNSEAGTSAPIVTSPPELVPLYSPRRLLEAVRQEATKGIVFIDVREPSEFAENHIPGALNIPEREFAARKAEIPEDVTLVPYCNYDFRGFVAARALRSLGFPRVALMQERGITGWRGQGLPVAGTETGMTDEEAEAALLATDPSDLPGQRYGVQVEPSGRTAWFEMEVAQWYFEPNDLVVSAGDEVRIHVQSTEGTHYFVMPDYEISTVIPEGESREIVFVANRAGDSRFGSCEWDGQALHTMTGRLRVRTGDDVEAPPEAEDAAHGDPAKR